MANAPLSLSQIQERIRDEHLDELLQLWWAEQGDEKRRDLDLIATAIPFSRDESLRVLDMCCGPGDVGRIIRSRFPKARIDCVDRDLFLLALCIGMNRRQGVPGQTFVRDLWNADWYSGMPRDYDAVATANALHWFDGQRVAQLFVDVFRLLRSGGVFLFVEPARAEERFAEGFGEWKAKQPRRYDPQKWERFWSRANALLGYDHTKLLGSRDPHLIGDDGLSALDWVRLLENAGFESIDVLLRDADEVIVACSKP